MGMCKFQFLFIYSSGHTQDQTRQVTDTAISGEPWSGEPWYAVSVTCLVWSGVYPTSNGALVDHGWLLIFSQSSKSCHNFQYIWTALIRSSKVLDKGTYVCTYSNDTGLIFVFSWCIVPVCHSLVCVIWTTVFQWLAESSVFSYRLSESLLVLLRCAGVMKEPCILRNLWFCQFACILDFAIFGKGV